MRRDGGLCVWFWARLCLPATPLSRRERLLLQTEFFYFHPNHCLPRALTDDDITTGVSDGNLVHTPVRERAWASESLTKRREKEINHGGNE